MHGFGIEIFQSNKKRNNNSFIPRRKSFTYVEKNWPIHMYVDTYVDTYVEQSRVARWYIFKPKSQIWVIFGGSRNGKCSYIL
jgi:hypothetical protein